MVSLKKKPAFFRLFRRDKKSLPPCMSYRYEKKGISMYLKKHHFKKMGGGGGVGDWLPSLELWYSMHKWVWAVATNPCCWTWSYCAAGTRATLKKKTIQLSQNEQAASNFAAFSEIFASYSGFRFKTTQVYTSAACSSTTIVKLFDWA